MTETEATITAIMGYPNGRDYNLNCQTRLVDVVTDPWPSSGTPSLIDGYVGSVPLSPLTANTDYDYQCRLEFSFDLDVTETDWVFGTPQILRTLDTHLDLTEINGSVNGTTVAITVDLVNTDGSAKDIQRWHAPAEQRRP